MDKEDILLLTDKGLAVFKYYIPFSFKLGRNFLNPWHKDNIKKRDREKQSNRFEKQAV